MKFIYEILYVLTPTCIIPPQMSLRLWMTSFFKPASSVIYNTASYLPSINWMIKMVLPQRDSNPCCLPERRSLKH